MTLFSKPKDTTPAVPQRCQRCRARLGTARLHFASGQDAPLDARDREAWLCERCRAAVQRGAADN